MALFNGVANGLFKKVAVAAAANREARLEAVVASALVRFVSARSGIPHASVRADVDRHYGITRELALDRQGWAGLALAYGASNTSLPTAH